jgi:imidazolonepropionase-like amidohydrolase
MCLAALLALAVIRQSADASPLVAYTGATLIDGTGSLPVPDSVVLVRGKRIVAAGTRPAVAVPPDARQVDLGGKWILPGLIDMHVHLDEDLTPSAFPLFGVTSVRDVGSRLVTVQKLRARASRGEALPRIFWMGRNIDEGKPSWWGAVAVGGPKGVPRLFDDMTRQGVDGVKAYVLAGPAVVQAVISEAHRRGWPVTGHLQRTKVSEAARLGIDNVEHVSTLFQELRKEPPRSVAGYRRGFAGVGEVDFHGPRVRQLIDALAKHRVAVTPTFAVSTMPVLGASGAKTVYGSWADVPPGWAKFWQSKYWDFISTAGWTQADYAAARSAQNRFRALVRALERRGVPIVAGTDTPAPWVLPGAGLIHELELLVEAGLSPMSAIQAATGRAARVLRRESDVGSIRPGTIADFVVLDADPLADIRNLRRIHAVYTAGRPVDLADLHHRFKSAAEPPPGAP